MYTSTPFLFLFSCLFGLVVGTPLAAAPTDSEVLLKAEISKLISTGIMRLSELPIDTIYPFSQNIFNHTTGLNESLTTYASIREILGDTLTPNITKRGGFNDPFGIVCETSRDSPSTYDVVKTLADINWQQRELCCQYWLLGSNCHEMQRHGGAAVGICGPFMRCVPCEHYINLMLILVDKCKFRFPDGRILVGGKFNLATAFVGPPYGGYMLAYHT